jgi:signal transduction histidine kinase
MVATGWQVASYLKGNDTPKVISQFGTTNCMTTDPHGVLWSKTNDAVVSYDGSTAHSMPPPEAVVFKDSFGQTLSARCQSIAVDNTGDLWISFVKTGTAVFRYSKGAWVPNGGVTGLPQETAIRIVSDERGRVWLSYTNNRLAVIDHGRLTLFSAKDGLNVGNIYAITVRGSHVWVGGDTGVDFMTSPTEFRSLRTQDNTALRGVSGIVETAASDLWLNATNGVYRFKSSDIQMLWHTPSFIPSFELFTNDDGLNGNPTLMWPGPTMVQSTDGRIWVTLGSNVSWIDPSAIRRNALAPTVAIDTMTAGSTTWRAGDVPALAPLTRDVRIAYASGSLTQPQRIRFKYRMDGLNDDWQDAGTRREASYTNLSPGNYRFRVMAFNEDGVASPSEATLNFMIEPAFYQTNWFRFFVAAIVLVMLWQLYQWRLRALERRYQHATDERIAERERIARDLHDTLLQGMQGILMQVDAWAKGNDLSTYQRESASSIERRMRSVLIEGRDAIRSLRQGDIGARDLAGDLRSVGYEAAAQSATQFSLQVEGDARALFPAVADEVFSIVREAISNACRHANAEHLDVTLTFSAHALKVSVRDDGIGISTGRLEESQKEGHWGIAGMSERARQLGGRLIVGAAIIPHGTVLTLSVPGRAAYATHPIIVLSRLRRWLGSRGANRL